MKKFKNQQLDKDKENQDIKYNKDEDKAVQTDNTDETVNSSNNVINKGLISKIFRTKADNITPDASQETLVTDENNETPSYKFDEFTDYSQAPQFRAILRKRVISSKIRLFLMIPALIVAIIFCLMPNILPQYFPFDNAFKYLLINAGILVYTFIVCFPIIINGIIGLFTASNMDDSAASIPFIAVCLQTVFFSFNLDSLNIGIIFTLSAVLAIILNLFGKVYLASRVYSNFAFVSRNKEKYAAKIIDYPLVKKEISRSFVGETITAGYTKTKFLTNFLQLSYIATPCETSARHLIIFNLIGFFVILIISSFTLEQPLTHLEIVTALAAITCVCSPISCSVSGNWAIGKNAKMLRKKGIMLSGYAAINKFSEANAVIFDASELYPEGTVTLVGVKTFSGERIDQALLDSAALVLEAGWPLARVFDQIIGSEHKILPKIDSISIESEHGISGWVNGRRIIIGSSQLMKSHGITPPSKDFEDRYKVDGRKLVYLASSGELAAMFVVTYQADAHIARQLKCLARNGLSIIIRTSDPNVTTELMSNEFDIPASSIKILSSEAGEAYEKERHKTTDSQDAYIGYSGDSHSLLDAVICCKKLDSNLSLTRIIQFIGVILGFIVAAFLIIYNGLYQISNIQVLIYQLFWIFATMISTRVKSI